MAPRKVRGSVCTVEPFTVDDTWQAMHYSITKKILNTVFVSTVRTWQYSGKLNPSLSPFSATHIDDPPLLLIIDTIFNLAHSHFPPVSLSSCSTVFPFFSPFLNIKKTNMKRIFSKCLEFRNSQLIKILLLSLFSSSSSSFHPIISNFKFNVLIVARMAHVRANNALHDDKSLPYLQSVIYRTFDTERKNPTAA